MKGPALIFVVLTLTAIMMIAGITCQKSTITYSYMMNAKLALENKYFAESHLSEAVYKIIAATQNPKGNESDLITTGVTTKAENGKQISIAIQDGANGVDLNLPSERLGKQFSLSDIETQKFAQNFKEYTSPNSLEPWSRKSRLEYPEEIFWVPDIAAMIQKSFAGGRLIFRPQPQSTHDQGIRSNPNIFSAPDWEIMGKAGLNLQELQELRFGMQQHGNNKKGFQESLRPELLFKIRPYFSFSASGLYRIRITVGREDGRGKAVLEQLVELSPQALLTTHRMGLRYWSEGNY